MFRHIFVTFFVTIFVAGSCNLELDRLTNVPCKHVCLFIAIKIQEREKKDFEKKKRTKTKSVEERHSSKVRKTE